MISIKKKVLVVCSRNRQRSLTAEVLYRGNSLLSVRSAGTSPHSRHQVSHGDISWSDIVLCMEQKHKDQLIRLFKVDELPKTVVANIADDYAFMDPELSELLKLEIESLF